MKPDLWLANAILFFRKTANIFFFQPELNWSPVKIRATNLSDLQLVSHSRR